MLQTGDKFNVTHMKHASNNRVTHTELRMATRVHACTCMCTSVYGFGAQ